MIFSHSSAASATASASIGSDFPVFSASAGHQAGGYADDALTRCQQIRLQTTGQVPAVLQREPDALLVVVGELRAPLLAVGTHRLDAQPPSDLIERNHRVGALVGVSADHDHAGTSRVWTAIGHPGASEAGTPQSSSNTVASRLLSSHAPAEARAPDRGRTSGTGYRAPVQPGVERVVSGVGDFDPTHLERLAAGAVIWRRTRSCAVDYAQLTADILDAVIFRRTHPWDHVPGVYLARRAGARAIRWNGKLFDGSAPGEGVLGDRCFGPSGPG